MSRSISIALVALSALSAVPSFQQNTIATQHAYRGPAQTSGQPVVILMTDASGAVIPNVQVTLGGAAATQSAVTSATGEAIFKSVPAGNYEVSAHAAGFKDYKRTITVSNSPNALRLDAQMQVGAEVVEVIVSGAKKTGETKTVHITRVSRIDRDLEYGAWKNIGPLCRRNMWTTYYGNGLGLGAFVLSPTDLVNLTLNCTVKEINGKRTLTPELNAQYTSIAGRKTMTFVNGSTDPSIEERVTPDKTTLTRGTSPAKVWGFALELGKKVPFVQLMDDEEAHRPRDPRKGENNHREDCLSAKDQETSILRDPKSRAEIIKPGTDGKSDVELCAANGGQWKAYDAKQNVFKDDVLGGKAIKDGTDTKVLVNETAQEVWIYAVLDDGKVKGDPINSGGTILAEKLVMQLSGDSGHPIIIKNEFTSLVEASEMPARIEAMKAIGATAKAGDKTPDAVVAQILKQVNAVDSSKVSTKEEDYKSGVYFRMGSGLIERLKKENDGDFRFDGEQDAAGNVTLAKEWGAQFLPQLGLALGYFNDGLPTNNQYTWKQYLGSTVGTQKRAIMVNQFDGTKYVDPKGVGGMTGTFGLAIAELVKNASTIKGENAFVQNWLTPAQIKAIKDKADPAIRQAD